MNDYHINIFFSEGDGGYIADIPDLTHCSAFGRTPEEALREVQRAKKAWLAVAKRLSKPIPEARYCPAIYQVESNRSGRMRSTRFESQGRMSKRGRAGHLSKKKREVLSLRGRR
jgi:predicted RNase H-like HicB family nuclease